MPKRGKGAGTTYQHKASGRWCAELHLGYDPDGKSSRLRKYFPTRKEAEGWLSEQVALNHKGLLANPSSITLTQWAVQWLERKKKEVRPNTLAAYHRELSLALPSLKQAPDALGKTPLQKVQPSQVRAALDNLRGYSLRTQRWVRQKLHTLFEDALDMELIHRNPVKPVKIKARGQPKKAGRALELPETQALLTALDAHPDPRTALSLRLMLACGLRLGEALGLQWQDIDLQEGSLTVRRAWSAYRLTTPKTASSTRTVPIPAVTFQRLVQYHQWWIEKLGENPPGEMWLFPGNNPSKPLDYNAPGHALKRIITRLGIPHLRVHDLRHSYGSHLLANGAPLELVAERMGHANGNITLGVYRHLMQHERKGWVIDPEDLLKPRAQA
jgi:integrase